MFRPVFFGLSVSESKSLCHREELVLQDTGRGRLYNPLTGLSARAFEACFRLPRLTLKSFSESIIQDI